MRVKSLDELRKTLLYNSSIDVWMTLCSEKGWQWRDRENYQRFIEFLKAERVPLKEARVGSPLGVLQDKSSPTYIFRLDDETIQLIRTFQKRS